jgi:DNA-binding NarL/FixJ family response regulator
MFLNLATCWSCPGELCLLGEKMKQTRLLIVDDHVVVRKGILMFLSTEPWVEVVGEAESGKEAVRLASCLNPDVILMDLVMPEGDGIEAIAEIKRYSPEVKVIVLTAFNEQEQVKAAIKAGANGYLLKDINGEDLLQAICIVRQGGMLLHPSVVTHLVRNVIKPDSTNGENEHLTRREKEVLQFIVKGQSNKAIAQILKLSDGTIKVHVSNILDKLNVTTRTEAAMWAVQAGLSLPDGDQPQADG